MAVGAGLALVAAACGGGGGGGGGGQGAQSNIPKDNGKPVEGGSLTYGLEADTLGGFCPPTAQLAAGGIQVFQAIYDTLTVPNDKGEYVPYLAKSIDHNPDFTQWTIALRDGITFHNGEPFNADAVKLNLDRFRNGVLFQFVFPQVQDVSVVDPMTVRVTTKVPWVAFPASLWSTGRLGMAAPAQLNDESTCPRNPIGTGPFKFDDWVPNDHLTVSKNPNYWQKDKDGNQLPYLDRLTFRPVTDVSQRVNGLKGGDLDLIHLTDGQQITGLRNDAKAGTVKMLESDRAAEISHTMLNAGKAPFNNLNARLAVAYASDRNALNQLTNNDVSQTWDQPYAPQTLGYQKNVGFPTYDPKKAEDYVNKYKQETGASELHFTLDSTPDPTTQQQAAAIKAQVEKVPGISVELRPPIEQSQYINFALGGGDAGQFDAILWRNFPGGDPDTLYVWWHSTLPSASTGQQTRNLVNFGRINDPQIDQDLDQGRSETDQSKRTALYQDIGKQFAEKAYNVWGWLTLWGFAGKTNVNGFAGPDLPGPNASGDGGARGVPIASVEPVMGLWISK
ncbi:MAG TPA: ABC transporter substrate-binding protein [Acidimicrobiia bacterium]|nr:ABC transporter substrate-binding protein [Acidimicrobiia bacterium]